MLPEFEKSTVSNTAVVLLVAGLLAGIRDARAREPIQPLPQQVEYQLPLARLGKRLFYDPRLSADKKVACASCHIPELGGVDGTPTSRGVYDQHGTMNSPTVLNAVFNFRQFWNGRAQDLREQAAGPVHNPVEMGMDAARIEEVLNEDPDYRQAFGEIFGQRTIDFENFVSAIVEFEKALITPNSRFDRYLRGEIELTSEEARGYLLFKQRGCVACHNGINVGGNSFQYVGVINPYQGAGKAADRYSVTRDPRDQNRFKVPSLRNIELTAPYFHDGSISTLQEAVEKMAFHNLGLEFEPDEVLCIVSFLKALTGEPPDILSEP